MHGARRLCWALALSPILGASAASAAPVRMLFAVGNDVGDPDDTPLRFADADAERVAQVFETVGGVAADHAYVLVNEPCRRTIWAPVSARPR